MAQENEKVQGERVDGQTKTAVETKAASEIIKMLAPDRWIDLFFERGSLAVLGAGGALALAKGLLGPFSIYEAVFGASLLLTTALAELLIWNTKRRSAERAVERAYRHLEAAEGLYTAAETGLKKVNEESPATTGQRLLGT